MTPFVDVAIVGAGHAGAQAAIALRHAGFAGSIAMITAEPELPYERPPLSKDYLSGDKSFDSMLLRQPAFWEERQVRILTSTQVVAVDPGAKLLRFVDGGELGYGELIWAAGGDPRPLPCPGADFAGVHAVRTRADSDRIRAELEATTHVVVIGGGYIGLEAAAVLSKLGKQVVVLEALDRVLSRVAGKELSAFFETEHQLHGVKLRTACTVEELVGAAGRVTGVRLAGGELLPADMVIVGIGIAPSVTPLLQAGAEAGGAGVKVDGFCRTSLPSVHAIGDCAFHANRWADGEWLRLESVQNAADQATVAAKDIVGTPVPYEALPWFWSNQFDLRLQTIGLSLGHDATVLRGDPASRSFSVVYLKAGRVIALDCVNSPRDYATGRKLVAARVSPDPARLADTAVSLKDLCA